MPAAEAGTVEEIFIDAEYVTKAYEQSGTLKARTNSKNGAVWRCFKKAKEKQERARITKVKSHQSYEQVLKGNLDMEKYILNQMSDAAAGAAAQLAQPPPEKTKEVIGWTAAAFRVARRIGYIEALHWEMLPRKVPRPVVSPSF